MIGWDAIRRELHPRNFFLATWRELDASAARERAERGVRYDARPLIALCVGAVMLSVMEYFGHTPHFQHLVHDALDWRGAWLPELLGLGDRWDIFLEHMHGLEDSPWYQLYGYVWWSCWRVFGYLIVPVLVVRYVFRERLRDYGLETEGLLEHAWIYVASYLVVLFFVVVLAKYDAHFRDYYPFYRLSNRSWLDFGLWELFYAFQFLSLEFFFRGFWLRALHRSMGSSAIFAMVVPYCMIHFGKPFLETLAAIFAGVFLGTIALRTRSIWSGFLIHVGVAVSMDLAAMFQKDGWPTTLWPAFMS